MIGLFIYILYKQNCLAKEQFSYQEPTQAIKNLGKLAKQLTKGGLTIPGNVKINGELDIGGRCQINTDRRAKDNMFIVHHPNPKTGFLYYNNGNNIGVYPSNKLNLIANTLSVAGKAKIDGRLIANDGITSLDNIKIKNLSKKLGVMYTYDSDVTTLTPSFNNWN